MKKIWLSPPHMSGKELGYIQEAFDDNWIAPLGKNVDEFEHAIKKYLNIPFATAVNSGTAALHLALIALGIGEGDEVIVPTFTFVGSVNPVLYQSAIPVFVDSEQETWNMDPELLEQVILDRHNKGKQPKAIIMVHVYGMPAKIQKTLKIARKYDIPVIEDAAEALGSRYNNSFLGTFGDIGILSFNGNKIITTSGGGALISSHKRYTELALYLATQAREKAPHYQHTQVGYNYRISNIVAGIGRGQMEVIEKRVSQRRNNFQFYREQLNRYDFIEFLQEDQFSFSNYWLTSILINHPIITRETIRKELEAHHIESRPLWKPMHLQPVFNSFPAYLNGISEHLFNKGLCLPSGSNLTHEDKNRIINVLHKILQG